MPLEKNFDRNKINSHLRQLSKIESIPDKHLFINSLIHEKDLTPKEVAFMQDLKRKRKSWGQMKEKYGLGKSPISRKQSIFPKKKLERPERVLLAGRFIQIYSVGDKMSRKELIDYLDKELGINRNTIQVIYDLLKTNDNFETIAHDNSMSKENVRLIKSLVCENRPSEFRISKEIKEKVLQHLKKTAWSSGKIAKVLGNVSASNVRSIAKGYGISMKERRIQGKNTSRE